MSNRYKNIIYSVGIIVLVFLVYQFRKLKQNDTQYFKIQGYTQGTTYLIKYSNSETQDYSKSIDSLLIKFSESLSTYLDSSEISLFNKNSYLDFKLPYFKPILEISAVIHANTNGAFDPTVGPLLTLWGFEQKTPKVPDSNIIDSVKKYCSFKNISFDQFGVKKNHTLTTLNFNAIAQGYSVDVVSNYLETRKVKNYLVEIGGELKAKGKNPAGKPWSVGIDHPLLSEKNKSVPAIIVNLNNEGLATSGNYRNYFEENGETWAHTFDPATGYPSKNKLLSVTIIDTSCAHADGYATACMVLGLQKTMHLIKKLDLKALIIVANNTETPDLYISEGLNYKLITETHFSTITKF